MSVRAVTKYVEAHGVVIPPAGSDASGYDRITDRLATGEDIYSDDYAQPASLGEAVARVIKDEKEAGK